jgi:hypothetical protein
VAKVHIFLALLKIIIIISSISFSILGLTIFISASGIKIDFPTDPNKINFTFEKDSLIIEIPLKIKNDGLHEIDNLAISISIFTLDDFLITKTHIGYPYEKIKIRSGEEKILNINIRLNLTELIALNIHEKILKDKAIKIKVSSNGRYTFNLIYFELDIERIIKTSTPFSISFNEAEIKNLFNILGIKILEIINENVTLSTPLKINYEGWMEISDLEIFGDIYDKKEKIATFYSKIDKLKYGENIINLKITTNKYNLKNFISKDLNLIINLFIKKGELLFGKQFKYNLNKQLEIDIGDIYFEKIKENELILKSKILLESNIENKIFVKSKIKIFDINNNLLDEKIAEINILPNYNEIIFENIIKGIKHGSVIKIEFFILEPINIDTPLITKFLIIP